MAELFVLLNEAINQMTFLMLRSSDGKQVGQVSSCFNDRLPNTAASFDSTGSSGLRERSPHSDKVMEGEKV